MIEGIKDLGQGAKKFGERFDRETFYDPETGGILNIPIPGTTGTELFGDEGLELAMFGEDGLLFDPSDPLDYITLGLAATGVGIPAAIGIKALVASNKLRKMIPATQKLDSLVPGAEKVDKALDRIIVPRDASTIGGKAKNYGKFIATEELVTAPSTYKEIKKTLEEIEKRKKKDLEARGEFIVTPKKDGGIIEGIQSFKIGSAVKQTGKKILKESDKKTNTKKTNTKKTNTKKTDTSKADAVEEGTGAGSGADAGQAGQNIFQRNKGKTIAAGLAGVTAYSLFTGGDEEEQKDISSLVSGGDLTYSELMNAGSQELGDRIDTVGEYMRESLIDDYGYSRNAQGGVGPLYLADENGDRKPENGIEREKPSFGEYIKSFGKGYGQRVANDPDFAKSMLAGFAAMMSPREGFAPLSPLGIPEFTAGYLAQEAIADKNKSAQQKLLEAVQEDPSLRRLYLEGQAAQGGFSLNQIDYDKMVDIIEETAAREATRLGLEGKDVVVGFQTSDRGFIEMTPNKLAALANQDPNIVYNLIAIPKSETQE